MLYCLDIDGTLVRSFMREQGGGTRDFEHVCPRCGEVGTLEIRAETAEWHCEMCPWHGDEADAVFERIEVLQGRQERIMTLALQPGARFALVTNQGGVAFGYQTVEQVYRKVALIAAEFGLFYGRPFSAHIALHHHRATVDEWKCIEGDERYAYRKPGPGMLLEAMDHHRADQATTWFIGDMDTDEQAARAAGISYYDAREFFR